MSGLPKVLLFNGLAVVLGMAVFGVPAIAVQDILILGWIFPPLLFTVSTILGTVSAAVALTVLGAIAGLLPAATTKDGEWIVVGGSLGLILGLLPGGIIVDIWLLMNLNNYVPWFPQFEFWPATITAGVLFLIMLFYADWSKISKKKQEDAQKEKAWSQFLQDYSNYRNSRLP